MSLPDKNVEALTIAASRAVAGRSLLLSQPDMLNGKALGELLGLSRATIDKRRLAAQLIALEFGSKRGFRFPAWQAPLILDHRSDFEAVLKRLAALGPWQRYRFFVQRHASLEGRTPIDTLTQGNTYQTLEAATLWSESEQGGN